MVQSTNPPQLDDMAHRAGLGGTRLRAVIGELLMGPSRVVVAKKFVEGPSHVASSQTITWSRQSRRTVAIQRSQSGFCHGER